MNCQLRSLFIAILVIPYMVNAQIVKIKDYVQREAATIGTYKGVTFKEAGYSGLFYLPGSNGKEFWVCSDRGVNIDCGNANLAGCRPTYDKMYAFPTYAPKLHLIRLEGDSIRVLKTITVKRPNGQDASGLLNPSGLGSTVVEMASIDTVQDCSNFISKTVAKDTFGIDAEGIQIDREGNFWLCEEGGATIWKLNRNGVLIQRFTPYANLMGNQVVDVLLDTVFKYRKNNRGFEGIAIAPNGKIFAIIQSPILYPTQSVGENTRIHRIIEIDPKTNQQKMYAYLNDGIIGAGSNQIRLRDWKIGDLTAINDSTFLVLEAAARGNTDVKRIYQISLSGATVVHSGYYRGKTLEELVDATGLANESIVAVQKSLKIDLLANGWPSSYDKAEGISIINDSTIAIGNDNDYGSSSPASNGLPTATNLLSHMITYKLEGADKLTHVQLPYIPRMETYYNSIQLANRDTTTNASNGTGFGAVRISNQKQHDFKIKNTGTDTLIIYKWMWNDTTSNPFKVINNMPLPWKIPAGDSLVLMVRYTPFKADTSKFMLQVVHNDVVDTAFLFYLKGWGITPEITVIGNGKNILSGQTNVSNSDLTQSGNIGVGKSIKKQFVVKNTGSDSLFVTNIQFLGNGALSYKLDSSVKMPWILKPGDSAKLIWYITPADSGWKQVTVQLINSDIDEATFSFNTQFRGVVSVVRITGNQQNIVNNSTIIHPSINTDFGEYTTAAPIVKMFKIANQGEDTLVLKQITSTNGDFGIEGINVWPMLVFPGYTQTFNVRWKKTNQSNESTIQIFTNDAYQPQYSFKIAGKVSTDIKESNLTQIKCYYNELTNEIVLEGISSYGKTGNITLYDVTGNMVVSMTLSDIQMSSNKALIPVQDLNLGIFYLHLAFENKVEYTNKIWIQQ